MSTKKSQYLLLFRGTDWHRELSANEIQEIMGRTNAWFDKMTQDGIMKGGQPLENQGRTVSFKNGSVADGPFAESKESIGGYILLETESFEEALELARGNPMIPYGLSVEVRPVADTCILNKIANEASAAALV